MIRKIHIENFKSHKYTDLELGNLTILCGQNGVGKSSVIQSLLLLRQTHSNGRISQYLTLNSPLCFIGEGKDAIYQFAQSDIIIFSIEDATNKLNFVYDVEKNLSLDFIARKFEGIDLNKYQQFSLFNTNFQYISAARGVEYNSNDYLVDNEKQLSQYEGKAELTAHFLEKFQKEIVITELLHESTPSKENDNTLLYQTTFWEREISKGINIHPTKVATNYEIKFSFNGNKNTDEFSSKNVGFGVSYSLPIIVAILSAKKDSLILIENPEAHLHPYGQAKLAELIAFAAQAGVQLIVETHSDHIINGVLVATKRFEQMGKGVNRKNVKIYYLDKDEETHSTKTTEIEILEGGKISNQPDGFFDQIEKDLEIIMGF